MRDINIGMIIIVLFCLVFWANLIVFMDEQGFISLFSETLEIPVQYIK